MTKLKIDLKSGLLEVEGEENFVRGVYTDYKDVLTLAISRRSEERLQETTVAVASHDEAPGLEAKKKIDKLPKQTKRKSMESYKMLGDLNLNPQDGISLRDFIDCKDPTDAQETNAAVVFYLQKKLNITMITPDHIYTCYKSITKKVPTALLQSLKDTMRRKAWIDVSDMTKIHLTTAGENFVEYDLPSKSENISE